MADAAPTHNLPEFSVGQISSAVKRTLEQAFDRVRVRGEISGFKRAASGHLYFALKDTDAVLDACCWRQQAIRLGLKPEDGMEVVVTGRLTTFAGKSKYQMIVETIELAGKGALLALIEARRLKLEAEGLFAAAGKPPLPFLPTVIGVITSPTGAVIRDILHRLADRFPRRVLVWPVAVQGALCAPQVAEAIIGFNALAPGGRVPRPDLLIVARGGGSIEDLMGFNDEAVVRAAAASRIPLISAVGHETDTTLIDFAATRRAPTPTAAAEMAVPVRAELIGRVLDAARRLVGGFERGLARRSQGIEALRRGLGDPQRLIESAGQRLDDRAERLATAVDRQLVERRLQLAGLRRGLPEPRALLEAAALRLADRALRLAQAARAEIDRRRAAAAQLGSRLPHPRQQIAIHVRHLQSEARALDTAFAVRLRAAADEQAAARHRLAGLADRLGLAGGRLLGDRQAGLAALDRLLEGFSYRKTLERGFAVVRDAQGRPVLSARQPRPADPLTVGFADGDLGVVVAGRPPAPGTPPVTATLPPLRHGNEKLRLSAQVAPLGSLDHVIGAHTLPPDRDHPMFIQTEATPNPATLKFLPGRVVLAAGTADFTSAAAAARSPLAQRLFDIPGVQGVFLGGDFVTVTKSDERDWPVLKPAILGAIMEHYTAGDSAVEGEVAELDEVYDPADAEIVGQIKELLETRVRPAVAQDGGDIIFKGYDHGVVMLHMQGSCSGCPSSTATLKMGIENMLRHYVPEVTEVRAVG